MYYIYYLVCPIEKVVRYVGQSKNPKLRYTSHLKKLDKLQTPKRKWLEMLFSKNLAPLMQIVDQTESSAEARALEQDHFTKNSGTAYNIHNPEKGKSSVIGLYPKKRGE